MLKKHYLLFFAIIGILAVIINSCKKDGHSNQQAITTDEAVAQARIWYERTYPTNGSKQSTQSTTTDFNFSQRIKPDWLNALSYNKFNKQVIELPIDSSLTTSFALKNKKNGQLFSSRENSKASFVLIKKDEGYEAYLMIVMADSAYIKNNRNKLTNNTYLKLDTAFTGQVLYISPEGKYISDSSYSNKQATKVQTTSPCTPGPTPPLPTKTNPVVIKTQAVVKTQTVPPAQTCIDWYLNTYVNGQLVKSEYQYTTCSPTCGTNGGGGGGGGGGGLTPGPAPTTPIFGINNSNAVVPDANFDNLLNYVESIGLSFSNPYNTILTVNGVDYVGQMTDIYQPNGTTVHFFSPDVTSGPFQTGMEYAIGDGPATSNSVNTITPIVLGGLYIAPPSSYLGNGKTTYVSSSGGAAAPGGGGAVVITPAQQILEAMVNNNNSFLIRCDSLTLLKIAAYSSYGDMYQQVGSFKPSQAIIDRLKTLQTMEPSTVLNNFNLQSLKDATGPVINSDFYPVKITQLPTGMTMATLTEYFRKNLNSFITPGLASFTPYVDAHIDDTQLFNKTGAQSVGALIHISMADDGTVVESDYQSTTNYAYYKFSTMASPLDNSHPVSGNREFGVYKDPTHTGQYVFYTMGVDRTSDWMFATVNGVIPGYSIIFNGADKLWKDMQDHMIKYINAHGGQAGFYNKRSYIARPDYSVVKDYIQSKITLAQLKQKIGC